MEANEMWQGHKPKPYYEATHQSRLIPSLLGKLGTQKLFTGAPIELPLQFLKAHDYVIELEDDFVLRFKSLICAARSSSHYQKPVIDQTTQQVYSWEECNRIVSRLGACK